MPVPGRPYTLQDVMAQLNNNATENIPLNSTEVLNQLVEDDETLNFNVSGSAPTFTTSTNYSVNIAGEYPIAYWRLAETTGGVAYDSNQGLFSVYPRISSSSQTTITQGGSSFLAHSNSASFTAAGSAITFPNGSSLQITGDLSVELWLKVSAVGAAATYGLLGKGVTTTGGTGEYELYWVSNGTTATLLYKQNGGYSLNPATTVSVGAWHHVVVTRVASTKTVTIYLDGSSIGSSTYTNTPTTTTGNVLLGAQGSENSPVMLMAETALYAKPLTGAQVTTHHSWGTATDAQGIAYGGTTTLYGEVPYPAYGAPTTEAYGASTTLWGTFVWK